MAEKKLIAKLQRNNDTEKSMKLITEEGNFICYYMGSVQNILALEMDELEEELVQINLSNLETLIKKGFTMRLGKVAEKYNLIISKGNCSTTYTATKENLIKTLQKADEWAGEFISELETSKHLLNI